MMCWKIKETIGVSVLNPRSCFTFNGPPDQLEKLYEVVMFDTKRFIPEEEMYLDEEFIGLQEKHNWLWASESYGITEEDLERIKNGQCLALNIHNEFVCFIYLKRD